MKKVYRKSKNKQVFRKKKMVEMEVECCLKSEAISRVRMLVLEMKKFTYS